MEKKQITLEGPFTVSGLTIMPVTRTSVNSWQNKDGISFFGLKRPLYILILDRQSTTTAFTITGESISPEKIFSDYPELREPLKKITGASGADRQQQPEGPPPTTR